MWTVLPLKAMSPVKTRLAPVLTAAQCDGLMRAMVEDVLTALRDCPEVEGVLLVSKDPDIPALAKAYAAEVLVLEEDKDLNCAVRAATELLAERGIDRVLVLHGDIPLASPGSLTRLIQESEQKELSLLPCKQGQGTNALVTSLPACIPFLYGDSSYRHHLRAAQQAGLQTHKLEMPDLALDIDTVEDLSALCKHYRENRQSQQSNSYQFVADLGLLHDSSGILDRAMSGKLPGKSEARSLVLVNDSQSLVSTAAALRDRAHGNLISYSRKVFIPLTHLCRDVCHYCTFAQVPRNAGKPFMSVEEVLDVARRGAEMGCREALLTLGEKPELRYRAAREALAELGFETTLEYVAHVAQAIHEETGLLPHVNAGCMDEAEIAMLRRYSPSMGIMLESSSDRLCGKGMPHHGSPDKIPARRIETIALAGEAKVPFTSGILIGIGETRLERIESLLVLRDLHEEYGHIQEVIIQNFRAKPGTLMAEAAEPDQEDLRWTIAVARIIFGADMNIQAPPNLVPESLEPIIEAGINDLGGISPPDPGLRQSGSTVATVGRPRQATCCHGPAFATTADPLSGVRA